MAIKWTISLNKKNHEEEMTNENKNPSIREETIKAIDVLLGLFTPEQKEILDVKNGDIRVTLVEQFVARWWNYVPIPNNPLVLKGLAAKVLATHKHLIDLIDKFDKGEIAKQLLDPEHHKKIMDSDFSFKKTSKRSTMSEGVSNSLTRILGKTLGGNSGLSEVYDFAADWDAIDRKRLDSVKFNPAKVAKLEYTNTETGEEDHAIEPDWMKKNEALESQIIAKEGSENKAVEFKTDVDSLGLTNMSIHTATLNQTSNLTAAQGSTNTFAFGEGVNRGKGVKGRSEYIMANSIYKIQAMEFVDIREQLYRKFDPFFAYVKPKQCL